MLRKPREVVYSKDIKGLLSKELRLLGISRMNKDRRGPTSFT